MWVVLTILAFTIYLFVSEVVRVDVAAILVMVLLGVIGIVPSTDIFDGFASNAVISIIAVMIIGAGLDRTGVMSQLAGYILKIGGSTEKRIIPIIAGTVGFISSFMQNVGAAALFLPVVSRISTRTGLPLSRLLMPMGFCAILGGTVTMIGSSPLILLNDLILTSNQSLPPGVERMSTFQLFDVTLVGVALLVSGILYFVLAGPLVLPVVKAAKADPEATTRYFKEIYGLEGDIYEARVPLESTIAAVSVEEAEAQDGAPFILGIRNANEVRLAPPRDDMIWTGSVLALMGEEKQVKEFRRRNKLELNKDLNAFVETLNPSRAGISEIVIPPGSELIGESIGTIRMRHRYRLNVLAVHRGEETLRENLRTLVLRAGDTLIVHSAWDDLHALSTDRNFVIVTDYPHEIHRPHKLFHAVLFFAIALSLVLFTDLRLSIALLVGAVGMILSGVLTIDEAYRAVSWQTVFLLASLIPLGVAVETTGTAAWIAQETLAVVGDVPTWVLQAVIAVLATVFTLVMSNVGATVLLVPLAVNIAIGAGANPAIFALTVALATSNSFLIPTHQVNALLMGPAGYRVADFMRAGGGMTVLFLVVMLIMLNVVF